jgi:gluconolactonase
VDETDTGRIHKFPIISPGRLGASTLYAELGSGSGPDGMCFDSAGRLIVAGSNAGVLFVIAPGGGATDMIIELDDPCPTNVCFGGPEYRTLFVTEAWRGYVASIPWGVPGMILFPDRGHRTPMESAFQ